jgi:geranylgeranylglycerol-phosphate geranylgeranyltransferase
MVQLSQSKGKMGTYKTGSSGNQYLGHDVPPVTSAYNWTTGLLYINFFKSREISDNMEKYYNLHPFPGDMNAAVSLIRPGNCILSALAVAIGAIIAVGLGGLEAHYAGVGLACIVAFLFTGAGNSLNDYYDRIIDRINHPDRPLPSGRTNPENAVVLALSLFFAAIILAFWINSLAFLIVIANFIVMISYETMFKAKGAVGNFTISWLTGTTFLFGGAAVLAVERTFILAALAFLATFGREVAKDIEDIKGDFGRTTLPMKVGIRSAGVLASVSIIIAILLSPVPILLGMFSEMGSFFYLVAVLVADIIFIICIGLIARKSHGASTILKSAMLIALLAFLAGGIL